MSAPVSIRAGAFLPLISEVSKKGFFCLKSLKQSNTIHLHKNLLSQLSEYYSKVFVPC